MPLLGKFTPIYTRWVPGDEEPLEESAAKGEISYRPGSFRVGEMMGGQNFGTLKFWCLVQEPQSLGYTAGTQFFGIRSSIQTDPDMQYTNTSLQKNNVSCRPREREMARIAQKISGGKIRHQCEKRNPPKIFPCRNYPPPPVIRYSSSRPSRAPPPPCPTPTRITSPPAPLPPPTGRLGGSLRFCAPAKGGSRAGAGAETSINIRTPACYVAQQKGSCPQSSSGPLQCRTR